MDSRSQLAAAWLATSAADTAASKRLRADLGRVTAIVVAPEKWTKAPLSKGPSRFCSATASRRHSKRCSCLENPTPGAG